MCRAISLGRAWRKLTLYKLEHLGVVQVRKTRFAGIG